MPSFIIQLTLNLGGKILPSNKSKLPKSVIKNQIFQLADSEFDLDNTKSELILN